MALPNIIQEINTIKSEVSKIQSNSGFRTNNVKFNITANDVGEGRILYDTTNEELAVCCYSQNGTSASSVLKLRSSSATGTPNSFILRAGDLNNYTQLFGSQDGKLTWGDIEVATRDIPTYVAAETLTAPAVTGKLCVVKASKDNAPNNGVVLSTYTNASWWGQLYIGDNSTQGIYFRGMSDGVVGNWYRLVDENRCKAFVTATYVSGTTWYRMYSDGWIEQGGYVSSGGTFTFPKAFSNNNYSVVLGSVTTSTYTTQYTQILLSSKSATSISGTKNSGVGLFVSACGY